MNTTRRNLPFFNNSFTYMHIPPYVLIHIKNFILQDYWRRKKKIMLLNLPERKKLFECITTATKKPRFKKEFVKNLFDNSVMTIYSVYSS